MSFIVRTNNSFICVMKCECVGLCYGLSRHHQISVEQECYPSGAPEFTQILSGFVLLDLQFCRSLFVLLFSFFWLLCYLSFFDLRLLISPFGIFDVRLLISPFGILDLRLLISPFGILDLRLLISPFGSIKLVVTTNNLVCKFCH